jgi:hypothetical protein
MVARGGIVNYLAAVMIALAFVLATATELVRYRQKTGERVRPWGTKTVSTGRSMLLSGLSMATFIGGLVALQLPSGGWGWAAAMLACFAFFIGVQLLAALLHNLRVKRTTPEPSEPRR